ncbi:tyrosinase [Rhypophila sp. PSN 637]
MLFRPTVVGLVALATSAVTVSALSLPVPVPGSLDARSPGPAVAAPRAPPPKPKKCKKKLKRKAWHTLKKKEKKEYIDAELCLMSKPATLGLPAAANRFEELQSIHQIPAFITHAVGAFLPYHRLHMHAHERALREECGYKGAQPYWDEPRDAGNFINSDVLDPITGFGGNGTGNGGPQPGMGCIHDGPFANFSNNLGPGYFQGTPNCIYRFVNDTVSLMSSQPYVDECKAKPNYLKFWPCLEAAPHVGGHGGVGGKMLDPIASPGDPIFYLHHTWLDKLFWEWQALDLPARLYDISGPNLPDPFAPPPTPDPGSLPLVFPTLDKFPPPEAFVVPPGSPQPQGDPGNVTTLSHVLDMLGVIPSATIAEVMNIGGNLLCYEYV